MILASALTLLSCNDMGRISFLVLVILLLVCKAALAQSPVVDSLNRVLSVATNDTSRIDILLDIGAELQYSNPSLAMNYTRRAQSMASSMRIVRFNSRIHRNIGIVYATTGKSDSALISFQKSLDCALQYGNDTDIGNAYNNLGIMYYYNGNFLKSLDYYVEALRYMERAHNIEGQANAQANIANLNVEFKNFKEAELNYNRALSNYEKAGDELGIAQTYDDLGRFHLSKNRNYKKAFECLSRSRPYLRKQNNHFSLLSNYLFAAESCLEMGDLSCAKEYADSAATCFVLAPDSLRIAQFYVVRSRIAIGQNDLNAAVENCANAIKISKSVGAGTVLLEALRIMAEVLSKQGKYDKAFVIQQEFIILNDSLFNSEKTQQLQQLQTIYETEKKENDNKLLTKENELKDQEIAQHRAIRNYLIGIIVLTVLVIVGAIYGYRQIARRNSLLAVQKKDLESKNLIIEERNKEITDSINYAKKIQDAYLPTNEIFHRLFNDGFILYKPRNIVSGDFYWFYMEGAAQRAESSVRYLAVADCTGHGVPGSLLSVICSNALNELVVNRKMTSPAAILNEARNIIISTLKSVALGQQDGMDIALVRVDLETGQLLFAGANNPLWIYRNATQEIEELKANKQPVGYYPEQRDFTQQVSAVLPGDMLYLFSDGFADQFGGPKGKKFKYKQLQEQLMSVASRPADKQHQVLESVFEQWKGDLEQVDDVCILGVRI